MDVPDFTHRLYSVNQEMKKVLIFSLNYYPRFIGGAEVALKEITDRISPEDIEFHVLTLKFDSLLPSKERIGNVVVHRIGFATKNPSIAELSAYPLRLNKYWYQLRAATVAEHLHREHKFDGIWAMMAHSCAIPAGIFKKRHPNVKYLLTLQEGDPPAYIERMMKPVWRLFRQGFTSADGLQTISTFLLAWGRRMGFAKEAAVVPNGVDIERFSKPIDPSKSAFYSKTLGKGPEDVYLVTTSRLVHKNAIDTVIRSLALLPEEVSFLIYGIGPEEEMLKALAQELGVEKRVRFLGQLAHEDMPVALAACDIFVRPSRSEGMGNSFVEAMAAGLPVIATQEGGIADFLFDARLNPERETTGWAVRVDTPEDIARAVEEIRSHPEKVRIVTAQARTMVVRDYNWDTIAGQMRGEVFGRILGL